MKTSTIVWIIIIIIIILAGWWYFSPKSAQAPSTTASGTGEQAAMADNRMASTSESMNDTGTLPMTAAVTLTASGFSPATITIAKGGTVTWTNETGGRMWVASAVHPSHEAYDGTSRSEHCASNYTGPVPFDQCGDSTTYSFTFNENGTWKYHNHAQASEIGTVVVQ